MNKITFSIEPYIHPDTQLRSDMFVVLDAHSNRVYERDYGHTGTGMRQYVEDYYNYLATFNYSVDMTYNTTETGY